jgi:hypothetical protein
MRGPRMGSIWGKLGRGEVRCGLWVVGCGLCEVQQYFGLEDDADGTTAPPHDLLVDSGAKTRPVQAAALNASGIYTAATRPSGVRKGFSNTEHRLISKKPCVGLSVLGKWFLVKSS